MDINKMIWLAQEISELISANLPSVWTGLKPVPFILYDDMHQVAVGESWPEHYTNVQDGVWVAHGADPRLLGCTSLMYHGIHVAIWDVRTWQGNPETHSAAAGIAHEMFHAFQQEQLNLPWANELLLPQYPHSPLSVALMMEENRCLAQMMRCADAPAAVEYMKNIISLRRQREAEIGARYMEYDKNCESVEGSAAYVEVKIQAQIQGISSAEAAAQYMQLLAENSNLLSNYRHRCYTAGLALCMAADIFLPRWQTGWASSGKAVFDFITEGLHANPPQAEVNSAGLQKAAELIEAFECEKRQKINEFSSQALTILEGDIQLTGFDPMNLTCADGLCLHLHGRISVEGREKLLDTPFLEEYGENILDVKRILLPC